MTFSKAWYAATSGKQRPKVLRARQSDHRAIVSISGATVLWTFRPVLRVLAHPKGDSASMTWRDIWRGTTASGRETVLQEDDDGNMRVLTTGMDDRRPIEIEPEQGESLVDALMVRGGFTAEEAATIEDHVEDRS